MKTYVSVADTTRRMEAIIIELKEEVKRCRKEKTMNCASHSYQEGILLTGDDAVIIIEAFKYYNKKKRLSIRH